MYLYILVDLICYKDWWDKFAKCEYFFICFQVCHVIVANFKNYEISDDILKVDNLMKRLTLPLSKKLLKIITWSSA